MITTITFIAILLLSIGAMIGFELSEKIKLKEITAYKDIIYRYQEENKKLNQQIINLHGIILNERK